MTALFLLCYYIIVINKDKTVLVVDDNISIRTFLIQTFEKAGYSVLNAVHGKDALALLSENTVDLITLDADMPVMDGFSTCEKIRANPKTSSLPVIMITAYNTASEIQRGFKAGVSEYLMKPIKRDELLSLVSAYFMSDSLTAIGKVAIISQEGPLRSIVDSAVRQNNFTPIFYNTIEELLESSSELEMIIIDVLEGSSNIQNSLQRINQEKKGIPIIILSDDSASETIVNAYMHGVSEYMLKPFETKVLSAKILSLYRANKFHIVKEENRIKNSRMGLLRELYVTLAHHINNILCALNLRLEHLHSKATNEKQRSIVKDLKEDAKKIESIIEKLENISKSDDIPLETYFDDIKMIKL